MQWPLGGQQRQACVESGSWSSWPSRGLARRRGGRCWSHEQQKWPPESVKEIASEETNTCFQNVQKGLSLVVILMWSRRESSWAMSPEIFTVLSLVPKPLHYSVLITYCMQIEKGSLIYFFTQVMPCLPVLRHYKKGCSKSWISPTSVFATGQWEGLKIELWHRPKGLLHLVVSLEP